MTHSPAASCAFVTARLEVGPWHTTARRHEIDLEAFLGRLLDPTTLAQLPPDWAVSETASMGDWIRDRDAEASMALAVDRSNPRPVGLLALSEAGPSERAPEIRLGYVIAAEHRGQRYGTELVAGLVGWASSEPRIGSLAGGVDPSNEASSRVLHANGFERVGQSGTSHLYRLTFERDPGDGDTD